MTLNVRLQVKPLSANKMFYRNKNKTAEYRDYQSQMEDQLITTSWPFGEHMVGFSVTAGLSNRAADLDNIIKPVLDTFQTIFDDFNDNKVYHIELHKEIVPKGDEYLEVTVRKMDDE